MSYFEKILKKLHLVSNPDSRHYLGCFLGYFLAHFRKFLEKFLWYRTILSIINFIMTQYSIHSTENSTESQPRGWVSNKTIQEAAGVSDKTVRRWAKEFGWRTLKINSRLIRFAIDDAEATLGVSLA